MKKLSILIPLTTMLLSGCGGGGTSGPGNSGGGAGGILFTNVNNSNVTTAPFVPSTATAVQGSTNIDINLQQGTAPTERAMELVLKPSAAPAVGQTFDLAIFSQGTLVYEEARETKNWDSFGAGGSGTATIKALSATAITVDVQAHLVPAQASPGTGTFDVAFTKSFPLSHS